MIEPSLYCCFSNSSKRADGKNRLSIKQKSEGNQLISKARLLAFIRHESFHIPLRLNNKL
jgi:hypothetical protein